MKIINSGTPLTGILDVGSDWLLRLPGTATFPGAGFTDGFIVAKFQLPTILSILEVVTPAASTLWYSPAQDLVDFFPNYGMGEHESVTTTLPESITISRSSDKSDETNSQDGTEVINTVGDGTENQSRNVNSTTTTDTSNSSREESVATPDTSPTLTKNRETIQYKPWKTMQTKWQPWGNVGYVVRGGSAPTAGAGYGGTQAGGGATGGAVTGQAIGGMQGSTPVQPTSPSTSPTQTVSWSLASVSQNGSYSVWNYSVKLIGDLEKDIQVITEPDSEIIDDSKLVIGAKTSDSFTQTGSTGALNPSRNVTTSGTVHTDSAQVSAETSSVERHNVDKRESENSLEGTRNGLVIREGEEKRTGGVQTTQTDRSVPAQVRYGFKLPRISYDPNTVSLAFSYMPVAEVRLTDTTGKVGISCMYSIRVESNPVQAIAPGDRSSPIRLPNLIPFKVTAYMAIRTETDFGKFGSAREEARKISLRTIGATSNTDILLDREMKKPVGGDIPIGNLKDPGQLGVAALSYVADLGTRLKTSNFAFPLLNEANLLINKRGRNLEFMVGSQVLTWEDASVSRTFGVQVIGPTPTYTQNANPRKSLVYS